MPLRRIGEKIVEGKNDGIPRYDSLLLPGLAQIDLDFDRGCL
jgi:hypothetical protein